MPEDKKNMYPTLKMPSPKFNITLLKDGKSTGVLSRLKLTERIGINQVIVNELNKPDDPPFAYGIVKMKAGKQFTGIGALPKSIASGIDEFTMREFQMLKNFWYYQLELTKIFNKPMQLKKPVGGRRYAEEIDLESDVINKGNEDQEYEFPKIFCIDDNGKVRREFNLHDNEILEKVPEYVLLMPGCIRQWNAFGIVAKTEKEGIDRASEYFDEHGGIVGVIGQCVGRTPEAFPVYESKFKMRGSKKKTTEIERTLTVDPPELTDATNEELDNLYLMMHEFFSEVFANNNMTTIENVSREDLINSYIFLLQEMKNRGKLPDPKDQLDSETMDLDQELFSKLDKVAVKIGDESLGKISGSGENSGRRIELSEVLGKFSSFRFRQDAVVLVGGLTNNGFTDNDIDILIKGPLDEDTRHILKFRIGRMLGPELSKRVQYLDESMGGPFTNHIPLGNLAFELSNDFTIKRMSDLEVEKDDDPLQDVPKEKGKREAVLQLHFRGKSAHADFRMKLDNYLVGWTLAIQKPNVINEPILTTTEAKKVVQNYNIENGNEFLKPFLAPKGLFAEPKSRQPEVWLGLESEKFEPGEVGATRNFPAVFIAIDHPKVQFGRQSSRFHEYFITDSKYMNGILMFRLLISDGTNSGGIPAEQPYWKAFVGKNYLPSVLERRSMKEGIMPPDGSSWLPESLEKDIPEEFRYWKSNGAKAKQIRDNLIESKMLTESSVGLVDGEIRLLQKKSISSIDYTLSKQGFRGPINIRSGYSNEYWWLVLDQPGKAGVLAWKLQSDPTAEEDKIGAIQDTKNDQDKTLLTLNGKQEPSSRFNNTKETPSDVSIIGKGKIDVIDSKDGFLRLDFKTGPIKGIKTLIAEEVGSVVWELEESKKPGDITEKVDSKIPIKEGIQIWEPDKKDSNNDRTSLEPLAEFAPMKPVKGFFNSKDSFEWATDEVISNGLGVEPKWNGWRTIIESKDNRPFVYFEDTKDNRSAIMPNVTKEIKQIEKEIGPFIFDGELLDHTNDGTPLPRRTLARFVSDNVQDDSFVRFKIFHILYADGRNMTDVPYDEMRSKAISIFKRLGNLKHFELSQAKSARTNKELESAMNWANAQAGSEGAMLKMFDSTYTLGRLTDSWSKVKFAREANAIVVDKLIKKPSAHQKSPSKTWIYVCAVGPISEQQAKNFENAILINDQWYAGIGKTFATNVEANVGDVLRVEFTELLVDKDEKTPRVHWFSPVVVERVNEKPSTVNEIYDRAFENEIKNYVDKIIEKRLPIIKGANNEEQIVYGVVLEPETIDKQSDIYSADEIRRAAHKFMEEFRHLGLMHKTRLDGRIKILETYLAPQDLTINGQSVKQGTWLMVLRILDKKLWQAVKDMKLTGLSIGGSAVKESEMVEVE